MRVFVLYNEFLDDIEDYSPQTEKLLDVPFVPSDEAVVEAMLKLGKVGPKDLLFDLGSGDGRIVITAARDRDTRGVGYDIDPQRIADAMEEAGWAGVEFLVDFIEEDIFTADIKQATIVTLYLLESVNLELRPRLLSQLRPGTRIVSHAFDMGDWKADDGVKLGGVNIFKWIVPARVAGVWEWDRSDGKPYRVELEQHFQEVSGGAWLDGENAYLESATLSGPRLELKLREAGTDVIESFTLDFGNNKLPSLVA